MIRIVTLAPFDEGDIAYVARALYQAFGLGTEHVGERKLPAGAESEDGRYDGARLLEAVPSVRTFADDKVLYLTTVPLTMEPGPLGGPPCYGFARYGGDRALVSTALLAPRGVTDAGIEAFRRRLARESVHHVGHLWGLHHCLDARCAMHPPWSPLLGDNPGHELDAFCRDKSEQRIRLAKT